MTTTQSILGHKIVRMITIVSIFLVSLAAVSVFGAPSYNFSFSGLPSSATYGSTYDVTVTVTYTWDSYYDRPDGGATLGLYEDDDVYDAPTGPTDDPYGSQFFSAPSNGSNNSGTWTFSKTFYGLDLAGAGVDDWDDRLEIFAQVYIHSPYDDDGAESTRQNRNAVPATPSSITVPSSDSDGVYSVSWGSSAGADSYELQEKVDSGSWSTVPNSGSPWTTPSARAGGHTYWYRVRGVNSSSSGSYRESSNGCYVPVPNSPPNAPSSPSPSNGATGISRTPTLSWTCSDPNGDTIYYTVYFKKDDSTPDNIIKNDSTGSSANPGTLDYDSLYYWYVIADDHKGGTSRGPSSGSWSFRTQAEPAAPKPVNPSPSNGATNQPIELTLSWQSGGGTTASYELFFGTNPSSLTSKGTQTSPYNPGRLQTGTTYYWRVDAKNSSGTATTGDLWSFTTGGNAGAGSERGRTDGQEYGDAVYRALGGWGGSLYNYNHAGVYAGISLSGVAETFESFGGSGDSTGTGNFETNFKNYNGNTVNYYGAYIPSTYSSTMPFSDRRNIVSKAKEVADANISYPSNLIGFPSSALETRSGATTPIQVSGIYAIRCDGLVEYAYEAVGIRVWRNALYPDAQWNIADYPERHNGLDLTVNPEYELSPWAQRGATTSSTTGPGYSGPPWPDTKMTKSAVVTLPAIQVTVQSVTPSSATVRLRATDESGIWRISYLPPGSSTWVDRVNPLRHPDSDSWYVDVTLTSQGSLYVKAKDHGGNEKQDGPYTITFPPQKATNPTPPDGSTGRSINQQLSWQNGGGATSYDVYFNGELKGNQTGTNYNPGTLTYGQPYTWSINPKNSAGTTTGDTWSFTTENEPPRGTMQFSASSYSVAENDGSRTITVTRTGGSYGAASVNYATANGSALAGSDYTTTSGTLYWSDGDTASKTFSVPISNDGTPESSEAFTVALSGATGATLGSPSSATVTILDDDQPTVSVTVQTSQSGRSFTVDGTTYTSPQVFTWDAGSMHTIGTSSPQSGGTGTQYVFANWSDGGAISHTVAPTVSTTYTANFTTQYYLTMNAGAGGTVSPSSGWYNSGAVVGINATTNAGYSFSSWTGTGSGSYSGSANPASVTMNGPISQTANFSPLCSTLPTPDPTYPACGGNASSTTPTLQWSDVANESGYVVRIYSGGVCSGSPIHTSSQLAANTTSYPVPAGLLASGQTYSWTVVAKGNGTTYCDSNPSCCAFTVPTTPTVATPTLSPTGGVYSAAVRVTAQCATVGALTRYTTNGTDPTVSSPPFPLDLTTSGIYTVKAKAFLTGYNDSAVTSGVFTINITGPPSWAMVWQSTGGSLARWTMTGTNRTDWAYLSPSTAGSGWTIADFAYLNGGGEPNILWRYTNGDLAVWFMNGDSCTNWAYLSPKNVSTTYRLAGTADLSGDGKDDLIWQGSTGWLYYWNMNGLAMTSGGLLHSNAMDTSWTIVGVGDFNGDAKSDLLWRHTSGSMAVWYMNGKDRTGGEYLTRSMADTSWSVAGLADVNGDNKLDIIWQHSTGYLAVWYMDGVTYTGWSYLNPKQVDPSWKIKAVR